MKRVIFGLSLALFMTGTVAAAEWRDVSYRDLHDALKRVALVQDAKYLRIDARFSVDGGMDEPMRMVIAGKGGDLEVPIDESGRADFPLTASLYEENPPVRVNVGEKPLNLTFAIAVEAPPVQQFDYALVAALEDEFREMVARQGMLARMFSPRPKGLFVEFAPGDPGTAEVRAPRPATFTVTDDNLLVIPFSRQWRRTNPSIVLSHMPVKLGLSFD